MEVWRDLIYQGNDYGYRFEVSTNGKLRNKITGTVYKLNTVGDGYFGSVVSLGAGKGKKSIRIHRAVAETFISNPDNKPQVNHIDGNKSHNYVANLEWVTNKENSIHAIKMGLRSSESTRGMCNINAKLTNDDVRYIRKVYVPRHKEYGVRALSRKFGVSHFIISKIVNNMRWRHIK